MGRIDWIGIAAVISSSATFVVALRTRYTITEVHDAVRTSNGGTIGEMIEAAQEHHEK